MFFRDARRDPARTRGVRPNSDSRPPPRYSQRAPILPVNSLEEVQEAFRARVPNDVLRGLVNTRVFLRTGVNLKQVEHKQNTDAELVDAVLSTLAEFGYNLPRP